MDRQTSMELAPEELPELVAPAAVPPGPVRRAALGGLTVTGPIPGSMVVGAADDPLEAAADRMADSALTRLRRRSPDVDQHQHGTGCEHVRRSAQIPVGGALVGAAGGDLDAETSGAITARRGAGATLPTPVRGRMETAFGRSFAGVRIHTDSAAASLNRYVSASAFTTGSDIFFGAGNFRPDTPGGEHMLAHELAHVVQGDSSVHRWPWTKDDPTTIAEKESKRLKEKEAKDQKKADKALDKAQAAQAKVDVKNHKKSEKTTADQQKADRVVGMQSRSETSEKILADPKEGKRIQQEFAAALEREKDLFALLTLQMDEEKARDNAYQQVWLTGASPELKAVRPPRETAAERLTSEVRKQRTENAVDTQADEENKLGGMLSKRVERVYEEAELYYDKLFKDDPTYPEKWVRGQVERWVWRMAGEYETSRRPQEYTVELQARADARKRLKLRPTPERVEASGLDAGIEGGEIAGTVGTVVGAVGVPVSSALKMAGGPKDKALGLAAGLTPEPDNSSIMEKAGPLGTLIKQSREAKENKAKGVLNKAESTAPKSDETKAALGIGAVTSILSGLISTVTGIMKAVKSISTAHNERNTRNILLATKSASDAVKSAASTAKSMAEFAKILDPGVVNSVASFVPGLNIGIAALGLISNGVTLADMSMRMNDVNNSVFDARSRGGATGKPDVLIYPLLKMEATYVKKVEEASWNTGISVSELATSIATVASAGGYGIPTAVQTGVKLVDMLHKLGHFVADNVLAVIVAKTRAEAVGSLEGSAENQLKKDPAMAVDALVLSAQKGDQIAAKFLSGYGITEEDLRTGRMTVIRATVLKEVGEDADPMTAYQKFKKTAGSVIGAIKGVGTKWADTGQMATDRNAVGNKGKSDRGFGWKVKMMFKGDEKFKRSLKKTSTYAPDKPVIPGPVERALGCRIGPLVLPSDPTDQEITAFLDIVEKLPLADLQKALADKANAGDEAQQILLVLVQSKLAETPTKVGV